MNEQEYLHMYMEEEHHWWYVGMRNIVLSILPPSLLPDQSRILDVGCGTGYNLGWFRRHYRARIAGTDYYPFGLSFCLKRGERNLVRGDAAALPFDSGIFDLVTALDVLSHVKDEASRSRTLQEFRRVLKPRGALLIRVAAFEWLRSSHDDEILTYHRYRGGELRVSLAGAGFQLLRLTYANTLLFPAAVLWRLMKKARLAPAGSDVRSKTRGANWMNGFLLSLLNLEAAILRNPRSRLSLGLSLLALASKPE